MKFITWNMQGATGFGESKWATNIRSLMLDLNTDVLCLQEAGMPPASARQTSFPGWIRGGISVGFPYAFLEWNLGTRSRPKIVYIFWVKCDAGANRNNLAIVSLNRPNGVVVVDGGIQGARPAIGIQLIIGGIPVNIFSLHAFSGGGGNAPYLLRNINSIGNPWFALGDYNRNPQTWVNVTLPAGTSECPHYGEITHPSTGTNLDYAFINPVAGITGTVLDQFVASDHYPVGYMI